MLHLNDNRNLLLGTGSIEAGNPPVNVGLLKEGVTFAHSVSTEDVKGGFPQTTVKKFKTEETATLTASMAEFSKENVKMLLGGKMGGGGQEELPLVEPLIFTHEKDGDTTVILKIHKGRIVSGFAPTFNETGLATMALEIQAEADTTKPKGYQLYELEMFDTETVNDEKVGTGDGTETEFMLENKPVLKTSDVYITFGVNPVAEADYTVNRTDGIITFLTAPPVGVEIFVTYSYRIDI